MELDLATVPFIILSVYIITQILKMTVLKSDNQRKALPIIAAIMGAAIAIVLFFFMPETVDFENVIEKLKNSGFKGTLSSEVCYRNEYEKIKPEEFFDKAYQRMNKLDEKLRS